VWWGVYNLDLNLKVFVGLTAQARADAAQHMLRPVVTLPGE
jgi:hypothetical protein